MVVEKINTTYSAFSLDVPGCVTTGNTIDETIQNMHEALELYLKESNDTPESRRLEYYLDKGLLDGSRISEEYVISTIEILTPEMA